MKKILFIVLNLLLSASLFGCASGGNEAQQIETTQQTEIIQQTKDTEPTEITQQTKEIQQTSVMDEKNDSMVYKDTLYGFSFYLPMSWKGYKLVTEKWEGFGLGDVQSAKALETGSLIYIRHPEWTSEDQRQDIPIMIFTLTQWESLQKEEFHIGAAPMGPSELGRNSKYVFALPARYNYAFLTGYEEVENILENNPLQPTE